MQPLVPYLLYFVLVSFVVALVTATVRLEEPRRIVQETVRFFVTVVACILLFGVLVAVLEWLFVRPLI